MCSSHFIIFLCLLLVSQAVFLNWLIVSTLLKPTLIHSWWLCKLQLLLNLNSGRDIGSAWVLVDTLQKQQGDPNASSSSSAPQNPPMPPGNPNAGGSSSAPQNPPTPPGNPNAGGSSSAPENPPTPSECGARAKPKATPATTLAPRPKIQAVAPKSSARSPNVGQLSSQIGQLSSQTATDADHEKRHSFHLQDAKVNTFH